MLHTDIPERNLMRGRRLLFSLVILLFLLSLPATVSAESPGQDQEDQPCSLCHWSETSDWEQSPHAAHDVTCEQCHGPYVEGHPQDGVMMLPVDASQCSQCHTSTHEQWRSSLHADAGVNCINCHLSHSQATRLQKEQLCCACHSGGFGEDCQITSHKAAGVTCIDCHVSEPYGSAAAGDGSEQARASNHAFTVVPSQLCLNCHGDELHQASTTEIHAVDDETTRHQTTLSERSDTLAEQLEKESD